MKLKLGASWYGSPKEWHHMVNDVRSRYTHEEWGDENFSYLKIDEYLRENFGGHLDVLGHDVSCIEFDSLAHYNWFLLRWS